MLNPITKTTIIVGKNDDLPSTNLHEELIMIDTLNGTYINLNKTGSIIWEYIEPPITVEKLIGKLVDKFKIDPDICSEDTIQYLKKMREAKLINTN